MRIEITHDSPSDDMQTSCCGTMISAPHMRHTALARASKNRSQPTNSSLVAFASFLSISCFTTRSLKRALTTSRGEILWSSSPRAQTRNSNSANFRSACIFEFPAGILARLMGACLQSSVPAEFLMKFGVELPNFGPRFFLLCSGGAQGRLASPLLRHAQF